ncbi:MAG TPA: SDR family NAD(P)-dependent oxidoreductase [Xanthobacteraceae bacterium]|jgi:NADP-dependent 3-hydroxy acid dehydrogenase YdfG
MTDLKGKAAWVTGAGSGVGEAAALALAQAGVAVTLTGRSRAPLQSVADRIASAGGRALVAPADVTDPDAADRIVADTVREFGRLDILVNNAGSNVTERSWSKINPERIESVLDANLTSAFYCARAALAAMRPRKDGLLIHTASWAGRWPGLLSGPAYVAAKHGVVAMSHTINMEEFMHGIRSTVLCPAEIATPILDRRPVPVSAEDRARMLQPSDMAELILYVARLPASVCMNEVVISPTWNRGYAHAAGIGAKTS